MPIARAAATIGAWPGCGGMSTTELLFNDSCRQVRLRSWHMADGIQHIAIQTQDDLFQPTLRWTGDGLAAGRIEHALVAGAVQALAVRLEIHGARQMSALLSECHELAAW